jgi:NADPH:quinone reductase-like Zn-dependent oxidoreductase
MIRTIVADKTTAIFGAQAVTAALSGALGLATLQLAKRASARVFTTASDDAKLARLKADFGADVTINYVKQDFVEAIKAETGGKGVDLVVDSIAGSNLTRSIASLKYRGRAIGRRVWPRSRAPRPARALGELHRCSRRLLSGHFSSGA